MNTCANYYLIINKLSVLNRANRETKLKYIRIFEKNRSKIF